MYYIYETDAGRFVLERQQFTECAWQFLFNDTFVDTYLCPHEAARQIPARAAVLGVTDPVLVPPASLSAWEIHWSKHQEGDAPELWLHRRYLKGQASEHRAA